MYIVLHERTALSAQSTQELKSNFNIFEGKLKVKNSCGKFRIAFSLLLCTYEKDNPIHLKECLDSILSGTVFPDEMIVVKDGPLTAELDEVLAKTNFPFETNIISFPTNQTLGVARREGVKAAKHDWVALMDSDDINFSNRFELQLAEITKNPNTDILGGQIAEFNETPNRTHAFRIVPITHDAIKAHSKKRNPFNAMTVMFKKDLAIKSGNFRYFPGFEDYDLWVRMIKSGAVCQNCEDVLVYARTGGGMYARRSGINYVKHEWRMQRQLRSINYICRQQFFINLVSRIPLRLLPRYIIERIYTKFLRKKF